MIEDKIDCIKDIKSDFLTTAYRSGSIGDEGYYLSPSNVLQADI